MTELQPHTLIGRNQDLVSTDLDGEIVLMSIERGNYYGLESTARRIWELLDTPVSLATLCATLSREYAAPAEVIESDVRKFVAKMAQETIVTLS